MRIPVPARVVLAQLGVGVVGAVVWWSFGGSRDALGALAGGAIGALLSLYVAVKLHLAGSTEPVVALRAFFRAMAMKFVLAVVLFGAASVWLADAYLAVVSTFAISLVVYLVALRWDVSTEAHDGN